MNEPPRAVSLRSIRFEERQVELTDLAHALDLRGALVVAEATLRCAIERRESRGAHQRADYPELDPALRVNYHVDGRLRPWAEAADPTGLRELAERSVELTADRLLE